MLLLLTRLLTRLLASLLCVVTVLIILGLSLLPFTQTRFGTGADGDGPGRLPRMMLMLLAGVCFMLFGTRSCCFVKVVLFVLCFVCMVCDVCLCCVFVLFCCMMFVVLFAVMRLVVADICHVCCVVL